MNNKIKQVALYVRKSRENNDSLEGQLSSLIDYCEKFDWEYEIFKEDGSASSEDWNRPELQRMILLTEKQHFDAIVVTEQSRITRADEFPKFRNVLQEANCLFITTQTNSVYDYNKPEDEFVSDIMSAVAKQEIAFAKLRLKRGTVQSAKKGNWLGKKAPIGYIYNKETKRLVPSDDAVVIKRLFEEYAEGASTKDLAIKFTQEGVTTTVGMKWTPAGISRLLNNIVYIGHSLYGRTSQKKDKSTGKRITKKTSEDEQILVENTHEPIISKELWVNVQRIKLNRNSKPVSMRLAKHKFSGLIKCAICGNVHSFQSSRHKKKRINSCQTRKYKSNSINDYEMCENQGCNLEDFEVLFFNLLGSHVDELKKYKDEIIKSEKKLDDSSERILFLERQLKKNQQDIKRIQQGFIMEIFTESEAQEQIKALKIQKDNINNELSRLKEMKEETGTDYLTKTIKKLSDFLNGHDDMPESISNEILKEYIHAIIYKKTEKENIDIKIIWK